MSSFYKEAIAQLKHKQKLEQERLQKLEEEARISAFQGYLPIFQKKLREAIGDEFIEGLGMTFELCDFKDDVLNVKASFRVKSTRFNLWRRKGFSVHDSPEFALASFHGAIDLESRDTKIKYFYSRLNPESLLLAIEELL